jgi:hypothetical protein
MRDKTRFLGFFDSAMLAGPVEKNLYNKEYGHNP